MECSSHIYLKGTTHSAKNFGGESNGESFRQLPRIMLQTGLGFPSGMVQVNYCGETLLDKEFADPTEALEEVMLTLRNISQR